MACGKKRGRRSAVVASILSAAILCPWVQSAAQESFVDEASAESADPTELVGEAGSSHDVSNAALFIRRTFLLGQRVEVFVGNVRKAAGPSGKHRITLTEVMLGFEGLVIDLGTLVVSRAAPRDGVVAFSIEFPNALLEIFDEDPEHAAKIRMGSHEFSGIWSEKLQMPLAVEFSVTDLSIQLPRPGDRIGSEHFGFRVESLPTEQDRWRGDSRVVMTGVEATDRGRLMMTADRIELGFHGEDLRLAQLAGLKQAVWLQMLSDALRPWATPGYEDDIPLSLLNVVVRHLTLGPPLVTNWHYDFALRNVDVLEEPALSLESAALRVALRDYGEEQSSLELRAELHELALKDEHAKRPETVLLPKRADVAISLDRLPARQLVQAAATSWWGGLMSPDALGKFAALKLLGLLLGERTALRVERFDVETTTVNVTATGAVQLEPVAALMGTGHLDVELAGLDGLMEAAVQGRLPPDSVDSLVRLHALGDSRLGEEGRSVHRYELRLDRLGEMLLNGRDQRWMLEDLFATRQRPQHGSWRGETGVPQIPYTSPEPQMPAPAVELAPETAVETESVPAVEVVLEPVLR